MTIREVGRGQSHFRDKKRPVWPNLDLNSVAMCFVTPKCSITSRGYIFMKKKRILDQIRMSETPGLDSKLELATEARSGLWNITNSSQCVRNTMSKHRGSSKISPGTVFSSNFIPVIYSDTLEWQKPCDSVYISITDHTGLFFHESEIGPGIWHPTSRMIT